MYIELGDRRMPYNLGKMAISTGIGALAGGLAYHLDHGVNISAIIGGLSATASYFLPSMIVGRRTAAAVLGGLLAYHLTDHNVPIGVLSGLAGYAVLLSSSIRHIGRNGYNVKIGFGRLVTEDESGRNVSYGPLNVHLTSRFRGGRKPRGRGIHISDDDL